MCGAARPLPSTANKIPTLTLPYDFTGSPARLLLGRPEGETFAAKNSNLLLQNANHHFIKVHAGALI